ncbi:MAG TPA: membrane protein insertase YidC [Candidatus Limnocylindrales bacterium]|nr:membrane protein insertase YidC [Candidatus Limnocylindrales bacterium]
MPARVATGLLLGLLALLVFACAAPRIETPGTTAAPGASPTPAASPAPGAATPDPAATLAPGTTPEPLPSPQTDCPLEHPLPTYPPGYGERSGHPLPHPLCPAQPSGDPIAVLAWLFTPIFQTLFLGLAAFYLLTGDIGIAIILLTIALKTLLIPLFRKQIVAQRRMQLIQPEIRALQQKFKGNRTKISEETMRLYRERGVNPAAGCLPMVLQLFLLLPIYQVVSQGLAATDVSSMLQVFGQPLLQVECQPGALDPCLNTDIWWLGGLDAHLPAVLFQVGPIYVSALAGLAAFLQLIQTRMMMPPSSDPQARAQQRIFMILPLLVLLWGFLPAGLFLYWIVFSAYSIVQQYFIAGWGSLFPLLGWTPGFARDHKPRFPVDIPAAKRAAGEDREKEEDKRSPSDRAAGTIRPARQRGRTSRRGRRR